jgi:hypothetical protein
LIALRRRAVPLLPFLTAAALVLIISVMGYGTMRFRIALDAVLPVLAALGVQTLCAARRRGTAGGQGAPVPGALIDAD